MSENFKEHYNLSLNLKSDESAKLTDLPGIRLSCQTIAKDCELDPQTVNLCLTNVFANVGELLRLQPNVEIELAPFGLFRGINREITFVSLSKISQSPGKQTVMGLIDQSVLKSQARLEEIKKSSDVVVGSPSAKRNRGFISHRNRTMHSISDASSIHLSRTIVQSGLSPIRRAIIPEGNAQIQASLLGAGVDLMAVNHESSALASEPEKLFKIFIPKPPSQLNRLPPIIDIFSRTQAAPITSQKYYFSVCHKIGSHYTMTSRGLYMDPESRLVKYRQIDESNSKIVVPSRYFVEPATEEEEYKAVIFALPGLKSKINSRKQAFERYRAYIDREIPSEIIAPINKLWIQRIVKKVPRNNLTIERSNEMFNQMLGEVNKNYLSSNKKSILDYSLKNENERERLGLPPFFFPPCDYGTKPFEGIAATDEWKRETLSHAIKMKEILCIFNRSTLDLMKLWQNYDKDLFVDLPDNQDNQYIEDFVNAQHKKMSEVKEKLVQVWHEQTASIIKKELVNLPNEIRQKFFGAVATLMSKQVRSLVESSIEAYQNFFKKFKKQSYATANEVAARKFDFESPIEKSFLKITIDIDADKGKVKMKETLDYVLDRLVKVIGDIIIQAHNIPRAESTICPGENKMIWKVLPDDRIDVIITQEISGIIKENFNVALQSLKLFSEYESILTEKIRLAKFIANKANTRDDYRELLAKYYKKRQDIITNLPCELRMNMFLVDCREINNKLINECNSHIAQLEKSLSEDLKEKADKLLSDYEGIHKKLNQRLDTEEILVDTELFLGQLKDHKKDEFIANYQDLVQWLNLILETSFKISDRELTKVKKVLDSVNSLVVITDSIDEKLRNERSELEEKLDHRRQNINAQLEKLTREIDKFKEREIEMTGDKTNGEILLELGELLKKTKEECSIINNKEGILGGAITEYSKIPQLEENFNNFEKLWNLVTQVENATRNWYKSHIFELDPDTVEKESTEMLKLSGILYGKLCKLYPKPAKKANYLREKMTNFNKNIDLISSLCNKALTERHWKPICDVMGLAEMNREDKKFTLNYFEGSGIFKNKDKIERLKDISVRATQEAANEKSLTDMMNQWETIVFQTKEWKKSGTFVMLGSSFEDVLQIQEEHLLKTQTMKGSPFAEFIKPKILEWETWLDRTSKVINEWKKLQSSWTSLESVFTSEDILQQLPLEGSLFRDVDKAWRGLLQDTNTLQKVREIMKREDLKEMLEVCNSKLEKVNKRLNDYLETKRLAFPRFFFLGNEQLLQILSDAKEAQKVQEHIGNCFDGIGALDFKNGKIIDGMISKEGENIPFLKSVDPSKSKGLVELWLSEVEEQMILSVREACEKGMNEYATMKRNKCNLFFLIARGSWKSRASYFGYCYVVLDKRMRRWNEGWRCRRP